MYELIQLSEHDFYIDCPAKIGLVKTDVNEVVLIDSGNDKDAGKKVYRLLEANGWTLRAIFNTHSHADHIGGNHYLQEKTGCKIYAKGMECIYANTPLLEPAGLYGGRPFKELRNKFLMAETSQVLPLTDEVLPEGMRAIALPGHSPEMTGFVTADGTAYIADCLSAAETLGKYGIGYLWDPETSLQTLTYVQKLAAKNFVPAHAPAAADVGELAQLNIAAINGVKEKILSLCSVPLTFETLLKEIFDAYEMKMSAQQYALIGSTIRSYLASMCETGSLAFRFEDNRMIWETTDNRGFETGITEKI